MSMSHTVGPGSAHTQRHCDGSRGRGAGLAIKSKVSASPNPCSPARGGAPPMALEGHGGTTASAYVTLHRVWCPPHLGPRRSTHVKGT
jgi:hypothetical protein